MSPWPEEASPAARAELETALGLALEAAQRLLRECEPIPPIAVKIDRVSKERSITVGHADTYDVAEAVDLIWSDLEQKAEGLQCVAVAAAAKGVTDGKSEPIVYVAVEHRDGHAVQAVLPYRRQRRLLRHKVTPGALSITPGDRRIWQ